MMHPARTPAILAFILAVILAPILSTACGAADPQVRPVGEISGDRKDGGPANTETGPEGRIAREIERGTEARDDARNRYAAAPASGDTTRDLAGKMDKAFGKTRKDGAMHTPRSGTAAMPGSPPELAGVDRGDQPAHLSAGETDDNENWREYLAYRERNREMEASENNAAGRRIITVLDPGGNGVPGATVTVSWDTEGSARSVTYADGRTLFVPDEALPESVTVTAAKGRAAASAEFTPRDGDEWTLNLEGELPGPEPVRLDVMFLLDSTGSMADEIDRIKTTLLSIAKRVSDLPQEPRLRFGMTSYRDREDDYVTRLYDFDGNHGKFLEAIRGVEAEGGGDTPESLNEAMHEAVNNASWEEEEAVRLMFLIADAPPHLDYPQDFDYLRETARARSMGIKVFSVATSGLDPQGEYIFRQIAQQTMGKFIFIVYESGVQGEMKTVHDVGDDFSVARLDSLIVRLIGEELGMLPKR